MLKTNESLDSQLDLSPEMKETFQKEIQDMEIEEENLGEMIEEDENDGFSRNRDKRQSKEINRHLGYHRHYLKSQKKVTNFILIAIFIVLAILVIAKFMIPDDVFYRALEETQTSAAILARF